MYNAARIRTVEITKSYHRTYPKARYRIVVEWNERCADDLFKARSETFHEPTEAFACFTEKAARVEKEYLEFQNDIPFHPSIPSLGMV